MISDLLFLSGVACIFNHELDAIQQHEWRFFFHRIPLSDEAAYRIWVALHAPLLVLIMWYTPESWFQIGFDSFLIAHAGVHWIGRHDPLILFNSWFSWWWIFGGAIVGAIHLISLL